MPGKKRKPEWFAEEQRGGGIPMMPAILTLFRITSSKLFTKTTGVKCCDFLLDLSLGAEKTYTREDQWERFCYQSYKKVKQEPNWQEKLVKGFVKRVPGFLAFCKSVYKARLKKKTNQELWQMYEKYVRLYEDIYVWGEPFAFGARFKLADYLSEYLQKILKSKNQLKKFDHYFNALITPKQKPFIIKQKQALLRIAFKISQNSKLKKLFKKSLSSINKEVVKYPALNKQIQEHTKKYQWVPYNYGAELFTKKYFLKEIRTLIVKNQVKGEINKIKRLYHNLERKQQKIIKGLKIDKYHQKLFTALRWNSFIIDYKKRVFTLSHFYINFSLMPEIAKRLRIKKELAHCLLESDVKQALLNNKLIPLKVLKQRFKRSVIFIRGGKIKLMINKQAVQFLKKQRIGKIKKSRIKQIKGRAANKGIVKGRAKIIPGPKDFKKMKSGNILVTHMTTPEFISILKKAKAIITDEGGITCHAAIISRELGIPCIIGTKIATKALKDGDLVEVDANKGIVRIIK